MVESVTLYKCTPNTGLILHVQTHRVVREVKKCRFWLFWCPLWPSGAPFGLLVMSKRWQMVVSDTLYKYTVNTSSVWPVQTHRGCKKGKKADFCCFLRLLEPSGAPFSLLVGSKRSYSIMPYSSHQVRHVPTATDMFDAMKFTISSQKEVFGLVLAPYDQHEIYKIVLKCATFSQYRIEVCDIIDCKNARNRWKCVAIFRNCILIFFCTKKWPSRVYKNDFLLVKTKNIGLFSHKFLFYH